MDAEIIKTPKIKKMALLPKKEYASVELMIPSKGIPAMANKLVIESGIRLVAQSETQRKNRQRVLYPSAEILLGNSLPKRKKKMAKINANINSRRIRSKRTIQRGLRSITIFEFNSASINFLSQN